MLEPYWVLFCFWIEYTVVWYVESIPTRSQME